MQMGPRRASGGAAQADDIARTQPVARLDITPGKMGVESFEPVFVAHYDKIAVALDIAGEADASVKGATDRGTYLIGHIQPLMALAPSVAELGIYPALVRTGESTHRIHQTDDVAVSKIRQIHFIVRIHLRFTPETVEHFFLGEFVGVFDVVPGIVVVEHYLKIAVSYVQGVDGRTAALFERTGKSDVVFGDEAHAGRQQRSVNLLDIRLLGRHITHRDSN